MGALLLQGIFVPRYSTVGLSDQTFDIVAPTLFLCTGKTMNVFYVIVLCQYTHEYSMHSYWLVVCFPKACNPHATVSAFTMNHTGYNCNAVVVCFCLFTLSF